MKVKGMNIGFLVFFCLSIVKDGCQGCVCVFFVQINPSCHI